MDDDDLLNKLLTMKQIRIERDKGYYGMMRKLAIVVDGVEKAELKQGESIILDLADDARVICGKMDWAKTKEIHLNTIHLNTIDLDQALVFKSYFTFNPLRNIGIIELPFEVFSRPIV